MQVNIKKHYFRACLYLALTYLLTYALSHIANYVTGSAFIVYLNEAVSRATYLLLPMVSATVMLIASIYVGVGKAILFGATMMLPRLIYFVPYFYMVNYAYAFGYDTAEAIPLALGFALLEALISFAVSVLLLFVMRLLLARLGKKNDLTELAEERSRLFSPAPISTVIRILSGAAFLYFFIKEIIDAVQFLSEYFATVRVGELIYMCWIFVFDIALFFIHFLVISYVKNRSVANMEFAEDSDED